MAAEALAAAGVAVDLYDAMPSVGRKFLLAGKGGLNLTHSEPIDAFVARYGAASDRVARWLAVLGPQQLREWAKGLGIDTFVGSSGRVFPTDMKAAPLLRAWLQRLRARGVRLHMRHRWVGWGEGEEGVHALRFATPSGEIGVQARSVVLALGGASWARLGSDGAWLPWLAERGVAIAPLQPSNCGFDVARWSEHLRTRFAGAPLKNVALRIGSFVQRGEFVLTETGIEGSLVYAASSLLRDAIAAQGRAVAEIDLLPERSTAFVFDEVMRPRGSRSMSTHLKSRLGLDGAKAALLHELLPRETFTDAAALAAAIKALPLELVKARPIDEAISSAGGVLLAELDEACMVRKVPGLFCAGEMLDWEAPTGGYLLTACFASGRRAGEGAVAYCAAS
ncbi:MAG: TIGR03862 family flavoprotein [Proteobacteria bacterium]|nr:TIGR03862 family flavoprotein [Pseudomonadota bacterium]